MRRSPYILLPLLVLLGALVAPAARAGDTQIVVYNKGKTLRYDPDVGAELKEVFLETYDCGTGKLAKKETIEAYFHLSDDKEIITPDAICDTCRTRFAIEKKGEKYYFAGIRDKAATIEEANKAAPAPGPGEGLKSLEAKVRKISHVIAELDPEKMANAAERTRIITAEFTTSLQNFGEQELTDVAGFVLDERGLDANQRYVILRSFGFTFQSMQPPDYKKAVFFYDKCIQIGPEISTGHLQRAVSLEASGEVDKALPGFAKTLALKTTDRNYRFFQHCVGKVTTTPKLPADKVTTLKTKLAAVGDALKAKDNAVATDKAQELEEWLEAALKDSGKAPKAIDVPGPGPGTPPGGDTPPPG